MLRIAKIGLNKVIVQGTSTADLRQGPGHYPGTPLPGEQGNAAIAGHRTTYGAPFYNLDELAPGDLIEITTVQGTFTYRVTQHAGREPRRHVGGRQHHARRSSRSPRATRASARRSASWSTPR